MTSRTQMALPSTDWLGAARGVHWVRPPSTVGDGPVRFPDGTLNACFNAADRHVALGRADQPAVLSAASGRERSGEQLDYSRLTERSAQLAGALRLLGVRARDAVVLELPLCADALVAALACARLGAAYRWGPAANGAVPLDPAPSAPETAPISATMVRTPEGLELRTASGDRFEYESLMRSSAIAPAECVPVPSGDPLWLDADEVHRTGESTVALHEFSRRTLELSAGDVVLVAPGLARTGHDLSVWAPLLVGATTVLPPLGGEPAPADRAALAELVTRLGVTVVLLGPDDVVPDDLDGGLVRVRTLPA